MKWYIHNNASHGTRYGKFDTRGAAVAAATERSDDGEITVHEADRVVTFRQVPRL